MVLNKLQSPVRILIWPLMDRTWTLTAVKLRFVFINLLLPCLSYCFYLSVHLQLSLHLKSAIFFVYFPLSLSLSQLSLSLSCAPCSGWWVWRDTAGPERGNHHSQLPSRIQQQRWLHLDCAGRARRHHCPGFLWLSAGGRLWPAGGQRHWGLFTVVSSQPEAFCVECELS